MPDNRDHAMDLYRVVALLLIVVGHWVAACLTFSDGAFWRENPLVDLPWTQWLTWIFQVVPVFFVVAGYASAVSWGHRRAEESRQDWLRRRLARPVGPTAVYVVFMLIVVAVLSAVGVAGTELEFGAWAVAMHLWFLGIYVLVVALTPVAVAAHRRWGLWVPLAMVVVVAAHRRGDPGGSRALRRLAELLCCRGRCSTSSGSPGRTACCAAAPRWRWRSCRRWRWSCWSAWGPTRSA